MSREVPIETKEKLRSLRILLTEKIEERKRVQLRMDELAGGKLIPRSDPRKEEWLSLKQRRMALTSERNAVKDQIRSLISEVAAEEKEDARSIELAADALHLRYPGWRSRVSKKAIGVDRVDDDGE